MVKTERAPGARNWIAAISVVVVVILVVLDLDSTSPGPLAPVHQRHPDLEGVQGCDLCHDADTGLLDCSECHAPIDEDIETSRGLHGELERELAVDCGSCHLDHLDGEPPLVGDFAFSGASYDSHEDYDHAGLAIAMEGKHGKIGCVDCHEQAETLIIPVGMARYRGLENDCSSCHEDPHEGQLDDCLRCHAPTHSFTDRGGFQHHADWPLSGGHAQIACEECHAPEGEYSVLANLLLPADEWRSCSDCHDSPHDAAFLSEVALLELAPVRAQDASCSPCHLAADASFAAALEPERGELAAVWHAATGFALEQPHEALDCHKCHAYASLSVDPSAASATGAEPTAAASFAARYPGRKPDDCASCHEDPHGGQFRSQLADGSRPCLECHQATRFEPHNFDIEAHAPLALPLEASHAAVACRDCHGEESAEGARIFSTTSPECAACHASVHDWSASAHGLQNGDACALCHDTNTFDTVPEESFDHALWTAFALDGEHEQAGCENCHPRAARADAEGRRFGRIEAINGLLASDCENCHGDAHCGSFDSLPALFLTSEGRRARDCSLCHDTQSFTETHDFDHESATSFALKGAHRRAECVSCHWPMETADEYGRTFGWVAQNPAHPPERCVACHADPHDGLFNAEGRPMAFDNRQGCARCHGEEAFDTLLGAPPQLADSAKLSIDERLAPFDHDLWTDFGLLGAHAELACTKCHAVPIASEPGTPNGRLGRAAGGTCNQCHEDVHGAQFADGRRTDCSTCHGTEDGDFESPDFDHERDSTFALDENHESLECAACHRPSRTLGGREVVRYKPLGTECADCHLDAKGDSPPSEGGR